MLATRKTFMGILTIISILIFAFLSFKTAFAEIGGLSVNKEVAENFENYRINPDYRYYFLGLENTPQAVVGLSNDYTIEDSSWTEIQPNVDRFRDVVESVRRFGYLRAGTSGAHIVDSQDNRIGVWYSRLNAGVVVDKQSRTLSLTTQHWIDGGGV